MIYNNILEAMGHTPMIRLNHMVDDGSAQVLVKFEGTFPATSGLVSYPVIITG